MKKIISSVFVLFFVFSAFVFAQDKAPSYFELDDYNHRYPETDTKTDYWLRSWKNSPVYRGSVQHGGWVERPYLTPGDPVNPPEPGAVLKYMKAYNHGRLDAGTEGQAMELRGWLLSSLGWFCSFCGTGTESIGYLEASVKAFRGTGADSGLADALNMLGNVLFVSGQGDRAFTVYEESLAIRRRLGDCSGVAAVLNNLGNLSCQRSEYDRAREYYEESLRLQRLSGNQHGVSSILSNLAIILMSLGDLQEAGEMLDEALELEMEIGDRFNAAIVRGIMCELSLKKGNLDTVHELCTGNLEVYRELGNSWGLAESYSTLAQLQILRGDVPGAAQALLGAIDRISGRDWDPLALKIMGRSATLLAAAGQSDRASEIASYVAGHVSCPMETGTEMRDLVSAAGCETVGRSSLQEIELDRVLLSVAEYLSGITS